MIKVLVNETGEEGEYIGVFQISGVIGESPMIGGHRGGVVAYPVVVAKFGDVLKQLKLNSVRLVEVEETVLYADGERYTFSNEVGNNGKQ